jgi:DNA replication protein DnaC
LQNSSNEKVKSIGQFEYRTVEFYRKKQRANSGKLDPSRYPLNRFEMASLDKLQNYSDEEMQYVCDWAKQPSNFFVYQGSPGVGKTYLSAAIYNFWWYEGKDVRYVIYKDNFLDRMKKDITEGKSADNVIESLSDADYLILDDIGSDKHSEFNEAQFFKLINARYNNKLPTFITTNLCLKEYDSVFGIRTASRLNAAENFKLERWKDNKRDLGL